MADRVSADPNSPEAIVARIAQLETALADVDAERRYTLGQTGVHLGAARVDYLRRSWASEEARLKAEIQSLRSALAADATLDD